MNWTPRGLAWTRTPPPSTAFPDLWPWGWNSIRAAGGVVRQVRGHWDTSEQVLETLWTWCDAFTGVGRVSWNAKNGSSVVAQRLEVRNHVLIEFSPLLSRGANLHCASFVGASFGEVPRPCTKQLLTGCFAVVICEAQMDSAVKRHSVQFATHWHTKEIVWSFQIFCSNC